MAKLYFERIDKKHYQERKLLKHRAKKALIFASLAFNLVIITYVILEVM